MSSDVTTNDPNVRVRDLVKIYPDVRGAFRLARSLFRKEGLHSAQTKRALDQVSFDVAPGEALGVIGLNGSGKSTLLQILSGAMKPTSGQVQVKAPLGALLELGAGFNPDCTGRENVHISASMYGMSPRKTDSFMEDVEAFADLGDYFDQPLRTYSSGMSARLAFGIALQMRPRVLLVDEILSVGDLTFQNKCFRHFEQLREKGTSLLIVSHDFGAIRMLCDKVMALHHGRVQALGDPVQITEGYTYHVQQRARRRHLGDEAAQDLSGLFQSFLLQVDGQYTSEAEAGQEACFELTCLLPAAVEFPVFNLVVRTMEGMIVYSLTSSDGSEKLSALPSGQPVRVRIPCRLNLAPGPYRVAVGLSSVRDGETVVLGGTDEMVVRIHGRIREFGVAHLGAGFEVRPGEGHE